MKDKIYCYPPEYEVLKNRFGTRDAGELDRDERRVVSNRLLQKPPEGDFDLNHLRAIHHHLFQDVYEWAGKTRIVPITKGESDFLPPRFIDNGMHDVHSQIVKSNYLRDRSTEDFAQGAGKIIGDLNYVHPFREGNGRTQFVYLRQLCRQAGHDIDLSRFDRDRWIKASIAAQDRNYAPMSKEIHQAIASDRARETSREARMDRETFIKSRSSGKTQARDKDTGRSR